MSSSVQSASILRRRTNASALSRSSATNPDIAAVSVRRRGALAQLECFPRAWEGRGLLGCHMRPV